MSKNNYLLNGFGGGFLDDFLNEAFWPARKNSNMMNTDIKENADGYCFEMDLPGFSKEDITADLKNGYLTVSAKHKAENEIKDEKHRYVLKERYSGQYQRSFYVGDEVTQEDITAKFTGGVLTLNVPKKVKTPEAEQKHYISIEG